MQLLDAISFQLDRHAENYFARDQPEYGKNSVLGIDLDMSWTEHWDFNYAQWPERTGFLSKDPGTQRLLPPYVTRATYNRIMRLTHTSLGAAVSSFPIFPKSVGVLALHRLTFVRRHLQKLADENRVVTDLTDDVWANFDFHSSFLVEQMEATRAKVDCFRNLRCMDNNF
jgi:hypothetical protein